MKTESSKIGDELPEINPDTIQRLKGNQHPVLVVGMHNSGTSILTEILHKNGVFFGANMQHYESNFFSNFVNDRIIMGGKGNWAKLPVLSVDEVLSFESSIAPLIKAHWLADYLQWGYDGESLWGIKDPRLCILLPLYLKIFPEAKVVHIRRNSNDVAASLSGKFKAGVGILNDFNHWKTLTEAYTQRVLDYSEKCSAYFELSYEEYCTDPKPHTRDLFQFLDIPYTDQTKLLLEKVTPSRIGSYQRMMEAQKHPLNYKIRSWLKELFG